MFAEFIIILVCFYSSFVAFKRLLGEESMAVRLANGLRIMMCYPSLYGIGCAKSVLEPSIVMSSCIGKKGIKMVFNKKYLVSNTWESC